MDRLNVKEFKTRWLRAHINPELWKLPVNKEITPITLARFTVQFYQYKIDFYTLQNVEDKTNCLLTYMFPYRYSYCIEEENGRIVYIYYSYYSPENNEWKTKEYNYYSQSGGKVLPINKTYYLRMISGYGIEKQDTDVRYEMYHKDANTVFSIYLHIPLLKEVNKSEELVTGYPSWAKASYIDNQAYHYMKITPTGGICGSKIIQIYNNSTNEQVFDFTNRTDIRVDQISMLGIAATPCPYITGYGAVRKYDYIKELELADDNGTIYYNPTTSESQEIGKNYDSLEKLDYQMLDKFIDEIQSGQISMHNINYTEVRNSKAFISMFGEMFYSADFYEKASEGIGNFVSIPVWEDAQYYINNLTERNVVVNIIQMNENSYPFYQTNITNEFCYYNKNKKGFSRVMDCSIDGTVSYYYSNLLEKSDDCDEIINRYFDI